MATVNNNKKGVSLMFPDIANSKEEAKLQQLNYDKFVNNLTDIVLRNTDILKDI